MGRAPRLLLRAAAFYVLIFVAWIPMQPGFMRLLAAGAERALLLIHHPPLITSVSAAGDVLTIRSYIMGLDTPMAAWNGRNIHYFMVATLALVLAVPLRSWRLRAKLALLSLGVGLGLSLGICIVQLETLAETYAHQFLGITLHTARENAWLEKANQALMTLGFLLVPVFLFLLTYLSVGIEPAPAARAERSSAARRPGAARSVAGTVALGAGTLALVIVAGVGVVTRPDTDPHTYLAGWAKLAALNPDFAPAHVNVGIGLEEEGRLDEAIVEYRRALRADPERMVAHYNLGNALVKKGLYVEAAGAYQKVLDKDPAHAGAHKNLAIALLYLGRPCEALAHLERGGEIDPRMIADARMAGQISELRARCVRR